MIYLKKEHWEGKMEVCAWIVVQLGSAVQSHFQFIDTGRHSVIFTWVSSSLSINSVELKQQIKQIVLVFKRLMFSGGLQDKS